MKKLAIVCAALAVGVLWTAYGRLQAGAVTLPAGGATAAPAASEAGADGRRGALAQARRSCDPAQLDRFVEDQQVLAARQPGDPACLRLLAEALLERVLLRNHRRGIVVGAPLYSQLPAATLQDVDRAQDLLQQARACGDDSAANWRLDASLMSQRITGLAAALQWNPRIQAALQAAADRAPADPGLHVALGLRLLLAPRLLGHDPAAALTHFDRAAAGLPDDERPLLFAAMAEWLLRQRQRAIARLEQAVARNPDSVFARVVLARLRRDEPDPFGRDVAAAEVEAR